MNSKTPSPRTIRKRKRPPSAENSNPNNGDAGSEGGAVIRALNESAQAMAQSFAEITSSLQERQAECIQKYVSALQTAALGGAGEELNAPYQAVLDAIASQDAAKIAEAQEAYLEMLSKVTAAATEAANAASHEYATEYEGVLAEAHEHGQKQYFQYIDTLQSVLAKAAENDLPPATLTMIAHNLVSAAALSQGLFSHSV
jgi:hypothetical protein